MRFALLFAALLLGACETSPTAPADDQGADVVDFGAVGPTGDGTVAPTSTVVIDYEGRLADGTVFDAGQRVTMPMGQVVPGFRDGLVGMEPGETKTFDVQPADGYGDNPPPGIPVGAVMTFEVTVHEIQ